MLNAKNLMIGNWVLLNGTPRKIQAIDGIDDEIIADDEIYTLAEDRYSSEDRVEGILITPEILEKNGLKPDTAEDAYKYCYRIESIPIVECYANAGGRYRCIISFGDTRLRITLMFVHQLQHAFKFVGIKKEIKIIK